MSAFAAWLAQTPASLTIQTQAWVIPTVQSLHIVAIGLVMGSALMMVLHVLGWAGRDQTPAEIWTRFAPWLGWALAALLATGILMVIGEPARELLAFSFWLKMALVAIGVALTLVLQRRRSKALAVLTLVVWMTVVVLGRLIAYDYVWGSWSTVLRG